ncbi:MAG TPA: molybdopterin dinucleotide binding domain-containing protein, partial [Dehalococcoidia bacterium]|nr:molybdopterin dinucleotide binding domain-containing protein [Dehalococcoidia bacterium]
LTIPDIDDNGALSTEQQGKRLGADKFRLLGEGYERLNEAMRRVWTGHDYLVYSSMGRAAHAPTVWRTILSQQPYPVRAVIVQQHNILGSYPNTQIAYQALKSPNLQLLVVHEQFMTATAQLADYVLPAAGWLEKPYMYVGGWDVRVLATPRAVQPQGERRDDYQLFADLARRLGQEDLWPPDLEALYDYMLAPAERNFQELASQEQNWFASEKAFPQHLQPDPQTGQPLGFGTPSGKVEIASNILAGLGYDPLPGYEEPMRPAFGDAEQYPFLLGTGAAVIEFMHQDHRQISSLRKRHPEPQVEIAPETAAGLGIAEGDWVWVETPSGKVRQRAKLSPGLHPQLIVAERWWYPERKGEEPDLYGLWESNINAYTEDDPDLCDPAYGNWPFRLGRCRVYKD